MLSVQPQPREVAVDVADGSKAAVAVGPRDLCSCLNSRHKSGHACTSARGQKLKLQVLGSGQNEALDFGQCLFRQLFG